MITLLSPHATGFPDPESAEPSGLLAVGGDLSVGRLLDAYANGIFPWYNEEHPILWWSPDPRPVLIPNTLKLDRRFVRWLRSHPFSVSVDQDFQAVVSACAVADRPGQAGTWLTEEMIRAYVRLHGAGHAHSVECRLEGRLVGGIYGVAVGRAFFGESMFHKVPQASKVAFVHLVLLLGDLGYVFMDCQQATPHVMRFGAQEISRKRFTALARQSAAMAGPTSWGTPPWWGGHAGLRERLERSGYLVPARKQ